MSFSQSRLSGLISSFALAFLAACAASSKGGDDNVTPTGDSGPLDAASDSTFPLDIGGGDSPGLTDIAPVEGGPGPGTSIVYANTDTELWSMDPATKAVTKIGAFGGSSGSITDVAVDGDGNVYVNSTTEVYTAALPAGGTGTVALTLKTSLPTTYKFYALGFVPKGVLTPGEALIAGDDGGDLYYIDTSTSSSTPQKLGSFGSFQSGDPNPSSKAVVGKDLWTLSGDVIFYIDADGTTPRGLASLRSCYTKSGSTKPTCYSDNDAIAEIDMAALKANFDSKGSSASLKKRFLGGSTPSGTGRLFGMGAWGDSIYAFSRDYKGSTTGGAAVPAELVQIGSTGVGSVLNSFGSITNGWSGAGVTTKAKITIIK